MTVPGYIPPDRAPFLPFSCKSGYELMVHLEKYGLKIRHYDLIAEEDIISECLEFMQSMKFMEQLPAGVTA